MNNCKVMCELNPRSHAAEAFRILRASLQFSTVDQSIKSLLITSPGPAEGKSTITANLGIVMAQAGARVILLDCDLRWPEQYRLFRVPNDNGLTDVLMGNMDLSQVLKDTSQPNLKIVTSGSLPPNPSELLASEKTTEIFAELNDMADIILIDSPPILMVADVAIISSIVDGCVLVIKSAKTKIDAVKQAKERLDKANARIVGTVLNAMESTEVYHYYDSYYYEKYNRKETAAGRL